LQIHAAASAWTIDPQSNAAVLGLDDDANVGAGGRVLNAARDEQRQRFLNAGTVDVDHGQRRREVGVDSHLVPDRFGNHTRKDGSHDVFRPYARRRRRELAEVDLSDLADTAHSRISHFRRGARGFEHLFLILVQLPELVIEEDVKREADFVESLGHLE
jgi:hypothetical protein